MNAAENRRPHGVGNRHPLRIGPGRAARDGGEPYFFGRPPRPKVPGAFVRYGRGVTPRSPSAGLLLAAAAACAALPLPAAAAPSANPFDVELARPIGGVWNEYANPGVNYPQALQATVRASADGYDVSVEYHRDVYRTQSAGAGSQTQYATLTGGYASVPPFFARDMELEGRALRRVRGPLAVGVGVLHTWTSYGYPALTGVGVGVARLPQWTRQVSVSASAFYYPAASGASAAGRATFGILKTDVAARFRPFGWNVYFVGGYENEIRSGRHLPGAVRLNRSDPFVGIGART